jgi:hypothetical protein
MDLFSWNMNGYRSHNQDLKLLFTRYLPLSLSLSFFVFKRHLFNIQWVDVWGYTCYRANVNDGLRAHGGVAILFQNRVHYRIVS